MSDKCDTTYDRTIAKGALFNALGIAGKAMYPLFFILGARLYGTSVIGVYYLAFTMIEISLSLVSSGFTGGTIMLSARYSDNVEKEDVLYRSLANAFVITFLTGLAIVVFAFVGGPALILAKYSQAFLLETVQTMALAVPLIVVSQLVVNATKGHLTMKWDALLFGFGRPLLLVCLSVLFHFMGMELKGLIFAYVLTQASLAAVSLAIFPRYFSYAKLWHHIRHFRLFKPLISFAVPQNLNMTFSTLITNLDVLMLAYFGRSESEIFMYGMGAQLVRNIRQVKLALSSSFAPLISKLHERKNIPAINDTFSMISRWIISIGLPIALVMGLLRADLLRLFDGGFSGDTTFMLLLLVPPLLSCGFGLAGNIIVMSGYSQWNLLNSVTVAAVNATLNMLLIPRFGMIGAALATVIASLCISVMQLIEAYKLVGTHIIFKQVYKPWIAVLPAAAFVIAAERLLSPTLPMRIGVAVCGAVIYAAVLLRMGVDERDKRALIPWYSRKEEDQP